MVKCLSAMQETRVRSLGQEDPLEKEMATTPVLLPEKFHGLRSLVGYSPWGRKESDMTEQLHFFFCPTYIFFALYSLRVEAITFILDTCLLT